MNTDKFIANTIKSMEDRFEKEHRSSYARVRQSVLKNGKICLVSAK